MSDDPPHRLGSGGFPAEGRAVDYGETTIEASGWELELTFDGDGNSGRGI